MEPPCQQQKDPILSREARVGSSHTSKQNNKLSANLIVRLCAVGFFVNCQPSESYLTQYLRDHKHLSEQQLDNEVWPYDTYASFLFLLPVAALAESFGYRQTVLCGLILREATRIILIFGEGVTWMAAMQVTYAGAMAANTVYFAYVYMVVSPVDFQRATSWVYASYHAGSVVGSVTADILVHATGVAKHNLQILFYVSWCMTTIGLVAFFLLLPPPTWPAPPSLLSLVRDKGWSRAAREISSWYKRGKWIVLQWSVWWVVAFGAYSILVNYYQNQFSDIEPNGTFGLVQGVIELFTSLAAAAPSLLPFPGPQKSPWFIAFCSIGMAVCAYASTVFQQSIYYSYALNIGFLSLFQFQLSLASACIAIGMVGESQPLIDGDQNNTDSSEQQMLSEVQANKQDDVTASFRFASLFSLNSFIALAFGTILQAVATAVSLSTSGYYRVIAVELLCLGGGFLFVAFGCCWRLVNVSPSPSLISPLVED